MSILNRQKPACLSYHMIAVLHDLPYDAFGSEPLIPVDDGLEEGVIV